MRIVGGAVVVLAGAVLFGACAVAQAIQLTVDRTVNFHLAGVEIGMPVGGILGLIGLVVLLTGFWDKPRRNQSEP